MKKDWLIVEDAEEYIRFVSMALHERGIESAVCDTGDKRVALVADSSHSLRNVSVVYYDLVLGSHDPQLQAADVLTCERADSLETLQHLKKLAMRHKDVRFLVVTHHETVPAIRSWLTMHVEQHANIEVREKARHGGRFEDSKDWARELVAYALSDHSVSPSAAPIAAVYWSRPEEALKDAVRGALTKLGYSIPKNIVTDRKEFGSMTERARSATLVWFDIFDENGSVDSWLAQQLFQAALANAATDFWIPVLVPPSQFHLSRHLKSALNVHALPLQSAIDLKNGALQKKLVQLIGDFTAASRAHFEENYGDRVFLGRGEAIRDLRAQITRIADHRLVLINGATGTGKEATWKFVVRMGPRADGPVRIFHRGAISDGIEKSRALGIGKGQATGVDKYLGALGEADGGTLVIDEGQRLTSENWEIWLRALEDPVASADGMTPGKALDVHFIVLLNEPIQTLVETEQMAEDVAARLEQGVILNLPTFAERRDDIPYIVRYWLEQKMRRAGRLGLSVSPEGMAAFQQFDWKRNHRGVKNVIERCLKDLGERQEITREDALAALPQPKHPASQQSPHPDPAVQTQNIATDGGLIDMIAEVLLQSDLSLEASAARLGVSIDLLRSLIDQPEVRSPLVQYLSAQTGTSLNQIAHDLLSPEVRTSIYRPCFVVNLDKELQEWMNKRVAEAKPLKTGKADPRFYGKVTVDILRRLMQNESSGQN